MVLLLFGEAKSQAQGALDRFAQVLEILTGLPGQAKQSSLATRLIKEIGGIKQVVFKGSQFTVRRINMGITCGTANLCLTKSSSKQGQKLLTQRD